MMDMELELKRLREKKSALENAALLKRLRGKTFESVLLEMKRSRGLYRAEKENFSENVLVFG